MSSTTSPLGLVKPVTGDAVTALRTAISSNADTLNTALGQVLGAAIQEGAIDNCYEVTQASGGASTTVDVSSNVGSGVVVQDDSGTGLLYRVAPTVSKTSVTITSAHATLPRVDAVVVSHTGVVSIVAGTATAGATLDNARDGSHGGAGVPSSAMHLADLLVPATDTTISNNQIRDRRKWARGAYAAVAATGGGGLTISSTSFVTISSALKVRAECSGVPMKVYLRATGGWSGSGSGVLTLLLQLDGTAVSGATSGHFVIQTSDLSLEGNEAINVVIELTPSAGSHTFEWFAKVSSGDSFGFINDATTSYPATITVEEVVRPNTKNNATTTG